MDTTLFFIIFTTRKGEKDTLSVMGINYASPSGISPFPHQSFPSKKNKPRADYNALGQSLFLKNNQLLFLPQAEVRSQKSY
jgi:hypothetical protein